MKILVVDDHAIVRDGLRRLLVALGDHEVLEAPNGLEALALARAQRPDLIILDLNLPGLGGLELLGRLVRSGPSRVLVLSMHAEPAYALRALQLGARGYLTKNATPDELLGGIARILDGGIYIEAEIAQQLALDVGGRREPLDLLSPREAEILRLLAQGKSLSEVAATLAVSYKTVANTSSLIKSKLGVSRTADLVRLALETGIS